METDNNPVAPKPPQKQELRCVICNEPSTRLVDGEPSCDAHANLVYENQLEDYIKANLA